MKMIFFLTVLSFCGAINIKPHGLLEMSKVFSNISNIVFEYKITPYNVSKFPFGLDEKLEFKFYKIFRKVYTFRYLQSFKLKNKEIEWNKSFKFRARNIFATSNNNLSNNDVQITSIGDILSETFDCWTSMEDF
ncbi:hypothetical protein PVAND_001072 [Polypedilum vanderplanki]|uniref:Uncharacterized protein n=1 Tax=Polypedilum vanderplanki TaxID=319348 RepID=A0A9J6BN54_POLVA|nr:hypothetical protein PVAND_001072 [Polypedilum vanderplanki]